MPTNDVQRVLVYRLGSIGDFIVALPCFRMIRERYATASIVLLTNLPINRRAAPAAQIMTGTNYVDSYIEFTPRVRNIREIKKMRKEIQNFDPELVIYLREPTGLFSVIRDATFFKWCGISDVVGLPLKSDLLYGGNRDFNGTKIKEYEGHRLFSCISGINKSFDYNRRDNWNLHLTSKELHVANAALKKILPATDDGKTLVAMSIGTKQAVNDWGDSNWQAVLGGLKNQEISLIIIGGPEDWLRSQELLKFWGKTGLNLCGRLSPRASAAALKHCKLFLGHDSGPMHLAAAVGTQCVAVFSERNPAGKWFPFGEYHRVHYPMPGKQICGTKPAALIADVLDILGANQRN